MKQLVYTADAVDALEKHLQLLPTKKIFLVRGKYSYIHCGAEEALSPIFNKLGIEIVEFMEFSQNPKMEEVLIGVDRFMHSGVSCILAVGGGSVLDVAKLIRHFASEKGVDAALFVMPTTAGTGAEATHFAVVYVNGKKQSIEADNILPDKAYLYPPFTYSNNAYQTACTGFDALAQAIEAFWSKNATEESDIFALRALTYLHRQLPKCVMRPTNDLRRDLVCGAYWAGRAINIAKTTAPHAFSYAFTSKCGYPHGHAVALTFPYFAEVNLHGNEKEMELRWMLHVPSQISLKDYFINYLNQIGLVYRGVNEYKIEDILAEVNGQRLANNPVPIGKTEIDNLITYFIT